MNAVSPARRPWVAALLALLSVVYLGVMFVTGARPTQGQFVAFEVAGLLRTPPARVTGVEVIAGARRWRLVREADTWRDEAGHALGAAATAELELGLKALHVTRPVRALDGRDVDQAATGYGFRESPVSGVVFGDTADFEFAFGALNPNGSLRYLRVQGAETLYLVSPFVADQWLRIVQALTQSGAQTP